MITALLTLIAAQQGDIDYADFQSPANYVVPFQRPWKNLISVRTQLNGQEAWFLLDTGAVGTYLTSKTWSGLHPEGDEVEVKLACGQVSGTLSVSKLPEAVEKAFSALSIKVDGVLGLDFLRGCALGLDLPNYALALFPATVDGAEKSRLWFNSVAVQRDRTVSWIPWTSAPLQVGARGLTPFALQQTPAGFQAFETFEAETRRCVTLDVQGVPMDCVLDTGVSTSTFLEKPLKGRVKVEPHPVVNFSEKGETRVAVAQVKSVRVGEYVLASGLTSHLGTILPSLGLVGMDILGKHKVLLDFGSGLFALSPYRKLSAPLDAPRYYTAEVFDPSQRKIMRFHGAFTATLPQGWIVLSGAPRMKAISSTDGATTFKIEPR